MRKIFISLLLVLTVTACAGTETNSTQPAKAAAITCTVAYRADVSLPLEREESIIFGDSDGEQSVVLADMVFQAAYSTGELDNERALRLWVTDSEEAVVYQAQLYQLPIDSGPQNQFVGGHGFTGLNYSYTTDSPAELQFWCEAN